MAQMNELNKLAVRLRISRDTDSVDEREHTEEQVYKRYKEKHDCETSKQGAIEDMEDVMDDEMAIHLSVDNLVRLVAIAGPLDLYTAEADDPIWDAVECLFTGIPKTMLVAQLRFHVKRHQLLCAKGE